MTRLGVLVLGRGPGSLMSLVGQRSGVSAVGLQPGGWQSCPCALCSAVLIALQELSRLAGQIRRLYGSNKKASRPFWICLTGFSTDSPLYEECLRMNDGFSAYLVRIL